MKTTFSAVIEFANMADVWLTQDPKNENTKLGWAIQRMRPRVKRAQEDFVSDCEDIRANNAAEKDGVLLKEENSTEYKYTREGAVKRNKEIRERLHKEIEIEPYIATSVPDGLSIAEQIAFAGFVIPEQVEAAAGD